MKLIKKLIFLVLLSASFLKMSACGYQISGIVRDLGTNVPLSSVHIYLQENEAEIITDSTGKFTFDSLCSGIYHLSFSHANCDAQKMYINLEKDSQFIVYLDHSYHVLKGAALKGNQEMSSKSQTISELKLEESLGENLGSVLENISGVRTLKTGNSVAKPVLNGLYGNRIILLNNGIAQAGQQWGNDHSPEIDPMSANRIRVLNGAQAMQYSGAGMGGVVLIESKKVARDPHLHGKVRSNYQTNGNGIGMGFQLEQGGASLAWRITGNIRQSGDQKSPDYFLTNTGVKEANASIQLEKAWSLKSHTKFYASTFNTEIGILRGSHIGNLTDLQDALLALEPLFTSPQFSYTINAPKQQVQHHLLKLGHKYYFNDSFKVNFTYASQWNERKEFDVRRGGRTAIPSLSLSLNNQFFEIKLDKTFRNNMSLVGGYQFGYTSNVNNPETGILPLIPDYVEIKNAAFLTAQKPIGKGDLEMGVRYENLNQNAAAISNTLPRKIVRYKKDFGNWNSIIKYKYLIGKKIKIDHSIGYYMRNPAINELYSGGLHQGVSGIEIGDENLKTEVLLKGTSSITLNLSDHWYAELLGYWQQFNNYIYLQPLNTFRLTIRGAFPEFQYKQVDAQIMGIDALVNGEINKKLNILAKGSYLKGKDISNNLPLINIPSGMAELDLFYTVQEHIHLGKLELENLKFGISNSYVFRQIDALDNQDFLPAPAAYYLLGLEAATDVQWNKTGIHLYTRISNALNTQYRDYLNRQRYFADAVGLNVSVGATMTF